MIYLFNRDKTAVRGIEYDDFKTITQTETLNGVIALDLEIRLSKVLKGDTKPTNVKDLFEGIEFVGHFDHNDEFQMYRIIKPSLDNSSLGFYCVHIFFDEAQAKEVIHNRQWRGSQAHQVLRDTFAYIGWDLTDFDSSKVLDQNAFRQTPVEIRAEVIDRYGVEVQPYLEFDGKQITRKCFRVKQKLGAETYDRFDYGSDLLKVTHEEDRGDIYTAIIPRGNGEQAVANSKIEIDTVTWSKSNGNPADKPKGQNWLEVPQATQEFGYIEDGEVKPRMIVVEFDTDDKNELIQLAWDWINQNCVPKSVMETEVRTIGKNYNIGDTIGVVYKQAGIIKKARVKVAKRDLKRPVKTRFEIGDYEYFFKNSVANQQKKALKKLEKSTNDAIEKANDEFNQKYDNATSMIRDEAQKVRDFAEAQNIALEKAFTEKWEKKNTEIDNSIKKIIGGNVESLNTNIFEIVNKINDSVKKGELSVIKSDLERQIANLDTLGFNMLRGTRFDEGFWKANYSSHGDFVETPNGTVFRGISNSGNSILQSTKDHIVHFKEGEQYTLSFDYKSNVIKEMNYVWIIRTDATGNVAIFVYNDHSNLRDLRIDGNWQRAYVTWTATADCSGYVYIGMNSRIEPPVPEGSIYEIKRPMLTKGTSTEWAYHPDDNLKTITEFSNRVDKLEDGMTQMVTRTDFNALNNSYQTFVRDTTATSEKVNNSITKLDNWVAKEGSDLLQSSNMVKAQVWKDDISNLGTENMIPLADFENWQSVIVPDDWRKTWGAGEIWTGRQNGRYLLVRANYESVSSSGTYGVQSPILNKEVVAGEEYTLVFDAYSPYGYEFDYMYLMNVDGDEGNQAIGTPVFEKYVDSWSKGGTKNIRRMKLTCVPWFSGRARVMFARRITPETKNTFYISRPMLVKGSIAPNSFSPASSDYLQHTDFVLKSDGFLLGTTEVGGKDFATAIVGNSEALNLIGKNVNVTGNLNVKNNVDAWSVSAVQASLGRIFANTADITFIKGKHIDIDSAFVKDFLAERAFIDNAVIKAGNIRDLDSVTISAEQVISGLLSSKNNSYRQNLDTGTTDYYGSATINFRSANNRFRMLHQGHIMEIGTEQGSTAPMFYMGGHRNRNGSAEPNTIGFAGIRTIGDENRTDIVGDRVTISEGGQKNAMAVRFDYSTAVSNRTMNIEPVKRDSGDRYFIGSASNWFNGVYTHTLSGLELERNSSTHNVTIRRTGTSTQSAGLIFREDDIYFQRGGTISLRERLRYAKEAYDRVFEGTNSIENQIKSLASRIYALEH